MPGSVFTGTGVQGAVSGTSGTGATTPADNAGMTSACAPELSLGSCGSWDARSSGPMSTTTLPEKGRSGLVSMRLRPPEKGKFVLQTVVLSGSMPFSRTIVTRS